MPELPGMLHRPPGHVTRGHALPWYFRLACWWWGHLWQRWWNHNREVFIGPNDGFVYRVCVVCGAEDHPGV